MPMENWKKGEGKWQKQVKTSIKLFQEISHILKLSGGGTYIKEITGNPPHADKAGFRKSYCEKPKTKVEHNLGLWPSCLTVAFFDD